MKNPNQNAPGYSCLKFFNLKSFLVFTIIISFMMGCQVKKGNPEVNKFFLDYSGLMAKSFTPQELESLLTKYEKLIPQAQKESELLKCRILIQLFRYKEAISRLDRLAASKPDQELLNNTLLSKVEALLYSGDISKALTLFKTIESSIKPGQELYTIWLYFSLYAHDASVRESYANKFLDVKSLPGKLSLKKPDVLRSLALNALWGGEVKKAGDYYSNAISSAGADREKEALRSESARLELIGNQMPEISADILLNMPTGSNLSAESLKGKVLLISFLAPWSETCRKLERILSDLYTEYRKSGLEVITCTKLYGVYNDDSVSGKTVNQVEEVELLKQYLKRNRITHPVAVSVEGISFEALKVSVIPDMIFVDRKGTIRNFRSGIERPEWIISQVKKLLEEN